MDFTSQATILPSSAMRPTVKSTQEGRVAFAEMSELVYFKKNSPQERKNSWYSKEDTARFKSKTVDYSKRLIEAWPSIARAYAEISIDVNGDSEIGCRLGSIELVCGIEHCLSPAIYKMIESTRKMAVDDVLLEQEYQMRTGQYSAERIAQASANASRFCRAWRHRIAMMNSSD